MVTVPEYLDALEPAQRAEFERLRRIVRDLAPDAVEAISYGMPTFDYRGRHLLHFGAFKHHMTLFPGTLKFTADRPLTDEQLTDVVRRRAAEIAAR
jgi:uncharacterized protein YdhG (YjbR/CyaY superfamily)